ncbi:hypothetical protein ACJ41O_006881 [Fusarium nematophilum]
MAQTEADIQTTIDFIADLPLYDEEKPYLLHPSASAKVDVDQIKTTNVEWNKTGVTVRSMRNKPDISLEKNGFCHVQHESKYLPGPGMGADAVANYRRETEDLMRSLFNAEFVHCYDYRLLKEILNEEQLARFFQPGYRFRLINTWRSILPECQDRPLAMCDFASIDPSDLVTTDEIYPTWNQEIYHLKYNKDQRWYWLPNQRANEPFLFMTFDSHSGSNARCTLQIISVSHKTVGAGG